MASHGKPLRDQMLIAKHVRRPSNMLLKDYLRDDLSSCSSSGFKSFPRRQCCTTVRFDLLAKDLQAKRSRLLPPSTTHRSSCSFKVASSTISALRKASRAVISAVKLLPFPSVSATPSSSSYRKTNSMKRLLSKSLSRKMLSGSFWRKTMEEEENAPPRLKSFREFLEEKEKPSDQHTQSSSMMSATLGSSSTSGSSSQKSNGNSWGSSEFTWEILRSTSDNSDVGAVSSENAVQKTAAKTRGDSNDGCTLEKLMDWAREEKEQLSPVSVLNCPFGDDEETNSPSDSTSCRNLGGEAIPNEKTQKRSRHLDHAALTLEPIDLEKRMAMLSEAPEDEANEKSEVSEEKASMLVNELQSSRPSMMIHMTEKKLLLDLLNNTEKEDEVSKVAKECISGESQGDSNMGWEVCVREMDKCERWTNISDDGVGMQLEFEVFTSLMNDLVLELTSSDS